MANKERGKCRGHQIGPLLAEARVAQCAPGSIARIQTAGSCQRCIMLAAAHAESRGAGAEAGQIAGGRHGPAAPPRTHDLTYRAPSLGSCCMRIPTPTISSSFSPTCPWDPL